MPSNCGALVGMSSIDPATTVSFVLNGGNVQLSNINPNWTLNEWIRSQYGLCGTKLMCGEGGCGCCIVSVLRKDPTTGKETTISINSVSFDSVWTQITRHVVRMNIVANIRW